MDRLRKLAEIDMNGDMKVNLERNGVKVTKMYFDESHPFGQCTLTDLINDIANQIDREHHEELDQSFRMPMCDDGTRLQFGDKFCDCDGNPHTLYSVEFLKYGLIELYDRFSGSAVLYLEEGQTVKRYVEEPIAKDGSPIKVGEIVYGGDGEAWEVIGIGNAPWSIVGKNGGEQRRMKPKWLTHEVPTVCDKDGLPILPGQKVITGAGFHMTVESVHYDRCPYGHIAKWVRYKIGSWDLAESVSHAKPKDTLKRIAEDEKKHKYDYWNCTNVWCDECPSKINGKNPRERYGVYNCKDAKTIDLYERRRKLVERGE